MDADCEVVGVTTCSTMDDYEGAGATSSAEDKCEVVSVTAADPFVFHPLHPFAKQFMCNKKLWITNVKNATVPQAIDILHTTPWPVKFFRAPKKTTRRLEQRSCQTCD